MFYSVTSSAATYTLYTYTDILFEYLTQYTCTIKWNNDLTIIGIVLKIQILPPPSDRTGYEN